MLWQLFLIGCVIWLLVLRWQNRGKRRIAGELKSDLPANPILGNSHLFAGADDEGRMDILNSFGSEAIKQGGLSYFWLGRRFFIACADPEVAEFVSKTCMEKDDVLKFTRLIIGNGSIFAPVPIWRPRRKVLAPTFNQKNLNQFVKVFSEQSDIMINNMKSSGKKGTVSIWKYVTSYTMDAIGETTLGIKLGVQNHPHHPFLEHFEVTARLVAARLVKPWLHNNFVYKFTPYYKRTMEASRYLNNFVKKIICEKKKDIEEIKKKEKENTTGESSDDSQRRTKTFLELIMESSGGCSEVELREETLVMMMAGTDTSAVGGCFTALMLSRHPDIQEKVYQEIIEIMGETKRAITAADLPRFKYLDSVLKETLRLYPPVPITARITDKEIVLPTGLKVEAGVGICLHIWATHRNPKYWGNDADIFRPERFFDAPPTHPSAYMPFGVGHRNCLGYQYAIMSMKTALATIVRNYRILPADYAMKDGTKPLRVKYDVMMKDVHNFEVQLEPRL